MIRSTPARAPVDQPNTGGALFNQAFIDIATRTIRENEGVSLEEALEISAADSGLTLDLIACADKIRRHFRPGSVVKCAIVNAKSGLCSEDCAFCAQSVHHNTGAAVYELLGAEQLEAEGLKAAASGATHFSVVTSGTALTGKDLDTVCRVAERLKSKTGLTLCASPGMLDSQSARKLNSAGVTRYHHNLETARSYFDAVCTTHNYDDDIQSIEAAKAAGLVVCSGGIFGMGESWAQRVELAFTLKELNVDSVPINFLNPIRGTRLQDRPLLPPLEALKVIALYRFIHPRKDITVCGGREATLKDFQSWIFAAGANGLMVGNYLTTQGRCMEADMAMIRDFGLDHGST
jgi:biotin synthase